MMMVNLTIARKMMKIEKKSTKSDFKIFCCLFDMTNMDMNGNNCFYETQDNFYTDEFQDNIYIDIDNDNEDNEEKNTDVDVDVEFVNHTNFDSSSSSKKEKKSGSILPKPFMKKIPIYTPSYIILSNPSVTKVQQLTKQKPFEPNKVHIQIIPSIPENSNPRHYTLPCKFGQTCKRDKCFFAHNIEELIPIVCKKHPILSETCMFFHPQSETIAQYGSRIFNKNDKNDTVKDEKPHVLEKTKMCKFGLKCRRVTCRFAHTPNELRIAPCMYGMLCTNWRCLFIHPDEDEKQMKERLYAFRYDDLSEALIREGIEFREDSQLCNKYVNGELEESWTLESVVRRMCEMRFLFEYTNFRNFYTVVKQNMTFDQAEKSVLRMIGGYPQLWPWNNN